MSGSPETRGAGGELGHAARVDEVFFAALERPTGERAELVADRCGGDAALEREVLSLLEAHEQTGPLDRLQDDLARWGGAVLDDAGEELRDGEPPTRLGRYEVRERLGAGGMAVVFRAHDPRLGRDVAVKVIGRRLDGRREERGGMLERFEQEARAASSLSHPNIITVHDFGEEEGHPFLVMELVEGESLRERLGSPLPVAEIVRLATQLADGLAAAHAAGVVHRDLKPENVLIDGRGTARILDFGLAVVEALDAEREDGAAARAGEPVAGTLGYAAPEVLRGDGADHRADQFALGAILYEMATGRGAFPTEDFARALSATLHREPPPVREVRSDLPAPLAGLVDRCLAKDPEQRFPRTAEILEALQALRASPRRRGPRPRGSLPTPATPLYGRSDEIRRLRSLVLDDGARLVTLTGVGGSGKTRLAIEAGHVLEPHFAGGVVYVPLAGVHDPALVIPTVAAALGGHEPAGGVELPALLTALSETEGPLLLVLDNVEHLIEAAPAVGDLLAGSPDLTVLATSRELLHLRAEHGFPVAPLALPSADASGAPEALREVPAVALFVARARAATPDFRLTEGNAPAVAELCRRLDGLPLALELAAARVRTLPPRAMLRRLENRMQLLTGGPRDLPPRQRTLRAALDWSHDLLDGVEQKAFRRLSVFSGGFTLEAAEAVVDPFGRLERDAVDLVESLQDRSLLQRAHADAPEQGDARSADSDEPRFAMLETIREYAAEHLGRAGEHAATRQAHAAYFLVLAEEAEAAFNRGRGPEWLDRFRIEEANFRVALDWLIETDNAAWGLRLARGLFHFWELGESFSEGRRRYEQLLALPSARELPRERAKALFGAGVLAASQRDHATGLAHHRRSLELHREVGDRWGQAVALNGLGIQLTDQERYDEARACYEESMELWQELGESHGAAAALSNFAYVLRNQGELDRSRRLYQQAAAMFERLGDRVGAAWEISHEADVVRDREQGRERGEESARLYRRALERFRELDEPWGIGSALMDLGGLAQEAGELDAADARYREALEKFCRVGHQRGVARVLEALAVLAGERKDHPEVLRLAGAAEHLRERLGRPPTDPDLEAALEAAVAEAYVRLGLVEGDGTRRHGREQPLERLIEALCGPQT